MKILVEIITENEMVESRECSSLTDAVRVRDQWAERTRNLIPRPQVRIIAELDS